MTEPGSGCTITDKQSLKLAFRGFLKNCSAVHIAIHEVLAVLWECLICGIVSPMVHVVREIFGSECSRICDFDTHFALHISNYIDWAVRRHFFDFIRDLLGKKGVRSLGVAGVTDTETFVL